MNLRNIGLATLVVGSLVGCAPQRTYVAGTVVKESGSVTQIVPSAGAFFGNESVKIKNPSYLLTIDINDGGQPYVFDVVSGLCDKGFVKSLELLAQEIEVGDRVTIPDPRQDPILTRYLLYADIDRTGMILSSCIVVGRN